jgi:hypothetical protein
METSQKTLLSVLSQKLAEALDGYTPKQLARRAVLVFLAGLFSAAVLDVQATANTLYGLGHWHGGALAKVSIVFLLTFHGATLWTLVKRFRPVPQVETIEAIPTAELLDHLFTEKTFKRDEVKAKFGVPQYRVTELTKNLKRVGVLDTGENGMSILNPEFSRQDVASMLAGVSAAKDLEPLFRRDELGYTSTPSAREIQDRVENALTPPLRAPNFNSRVLAS